jgi:hypothetical protein
MKEVIYLQILIKFVNWWMNYFCLLLNAERVVRIRQTEIQTAEPFVPDPSISEAEDAIAKLKRYKSPDADQIPAKLIQAGRETLHSEIHKFIKSIRNKEELPHQWQESTVVPINKRGDKLSVVIIKAYHCCQLHTYSRVCIGKICLISLLFRMA